MLEDTKLNIVVTGSIPEPNHDTPFPAEEGTEDKVITYLKSMREACSQNEIGIIINDNTTDRLIIRAFSDAPDRFVLTNDYEYRSVVTNSMAFIIMVISGEEDVHKDYDVFMDINYNRPCCRYGILGSDGLCAGGTRWVEPLDLSFGTRDVKGNLEKPINMFNEFFEKMIELQNILNIGKKSRESAR